MDAARAAAATAAAVIVGSVVGRGRGRRADRLSAFGTVRGLNSCALAKADYYYCFSCSLRLMCYLRYFGFG